MAWFTRREKGIQTPTEFKKEAPDGLWYRCPSCKHLMLTKDHKKNAWVCEECEHHERIGSKDYFHILFDGEYEPFNDNIISKDPLHFEDTAPYVDRLKKARSKTGLNDAVSTAKGKSYGRDIVIACMDFSFIGGSMGSVVGEKIARAIDVARENKFPFLMISKSGGARMMEAGLSLMQMAKTSAKLALLDKAKVPYISLMTHPTTGGVTASYAMLGDFNIAEPKALIGFAGPRVIKETIGKDLPAGFQSAEFLKEQGFLDFVVDRTELKEQLRDLLDLIS